MSVARFTTVIDESRHLSLTLPPDMHAGPVEVIVRQEVLSAKTPFPKKRVSDEEHAEMLAFHKGRRLNGLTIRELKEEGRR